jgi:hypothetical protein
MSDLVDLLDWGLESASQMCMEVSAGKLERVEGGVIGRSLGESSPGGLCD